MSINEKIYPDSASNIKGIPIEVLKDNNSLPIIFEDNKLSNSAPFLIDGGDESENKFVICPRAQRMTRLYNSDHILERGEVCIETDTGFVRFGDGSESIKNLNKYMMLPVPPLTSQKQVLYLKTNSEINQNILSNGNFENGLTGWEIYTDEGNNTVTSSVVNDETDGNCLHINLAPSVLNPCSLKLQFGTVFTLVDQTALGVKLKRGAYGTSGTVKIEYLSNYNWTTIQTINLADIPTTWTLYSNDITGLPIENIRINLVGVQGTRSDVYIDTITTSPMNFFTGENDGSFENGLGPWYIESNEASGNTQVSGVIDTDGADGTHSVHLDLLGVPNSEKYVEVAYQEISTCICLQAVLKFKAKSGSNTSGMLSLEYGNNSIAKDILLTSIPSTMTEYSYLIQPTGWFDTDIRIETIAIILRVQNQQHGEVYIDDVQLFPYNPEYGWIEDIDTYHDPRYLQKSPAVADIPATIPRYLGSFASAPTENIREGDEYWDTATSKGRKYMGGEWRDLT